MARRTRSLLALAGAAALRTLAPCACRPALPDLALAGTSTLRALEPCVCRPALPDLASAFGQRVDSVPLPRTAEEVVSALSASLKAAFDQKLPRVDLELPPGFRLGFEGIKDELLPVARLTEKRIEQGDRELAACVLLAMGEPAGLSVVFRSEAKLAKARRAWRTWGQSRLRAFPREASGFSAGRELDLGNCDCVLAVAPREPQLRVLEELDERLGEQTRMMLVNARLREHPRGELKERLSVAFNPAFCLQLVGDGGLVFHAVRPGKSSTPWVLGRRKLPDLEAVEVTRSNEELSAEALAEVKGG